jgi:hypothetical protein
MTAQNPTLMEQATIDRLGIFDEEKFAEIVSDASPKCSWFLHDFDDEECGAAATHAARCRTCRRWSKFLCTTHADILPIDRQPITHVPCGTCGPLCEVMGVGPL